MKKLALLTIIFIYGLQFGYTQPGKPDPAFGRNGIITADLGVNYHYEILAKKLLLQPDGSMYLIIQAGSQTIIARQHPDGSSDLNYGHEGLSNPGIIYASDAALQTDGKLVVAGNSNEDFALVRFNTDGTLDNTFGNKGKQTTDFDHRNDGANSLAIQSDGKIVVVGGTYRPSTTFTFAIARYNVDGSLDKTFLQGGKYSDETYQIGFGISVALQNDQKILVIAAGNDGGSSDFSLARYNPDGSFDKTFSNDGIVSMDFGFTGTSLAIQKDGRIIIGGSSLARFDTDGSPDETFGNDGIQMNGFNGVANTVAINGDGKIFVAGSQTIVRYNSNGSLDKTFSENGKTEVNFDPVSMAASGDGNIILAGGGFVRYDSKGILDVPFNKGGKLPYDLQHGYTAFTKTKIQNDGKIVVSGYTWNGNDFEWLLARYDTDGTIDSTFGDNGIRKLDFEVLSLDIGNDGKLVVISKVSECNESGCHDKFALVRYDNKGAPDKTFFGNGTLPVDFDIASVAIQRDGKIVVVGEGGVTNAFGDRFGTFAVARYNSDGSPNTGFADDGKISETFYDSEGNLTNSGASLLAIQDDGKIVLGGSVARNTQFDEHTEVFRYNTDGSPDATFQALRFEFNEPTSLAVGHNGKIAVAGIIRERWNDRAGVATSGSDAFEVTGSYLPYGSYAVAIQDDGKILIAGPVLARFKANGSLDSTFSNDGLQTTEVTAGYAQISDIAISDNKLYAIGYGLFSATLGLISRYFLGDFESAPPTITLTAPTNNASYIANVKTLKLSATAEDDDGTISKVEFFNGTTLLHTETVVPYGFVWTNIPAGNYTLTAKATDNSGLVTTSTPVHITVALNKPPTVSIINPANSKTFPAPATIHLEAAAKDADGKITRVEFYNGTTLLTTERKLPYTFAWTKVQLGNYTITAKAFDNWGAVTTSAAVNVSVVPNKAPTVSITNPANGESFLAPAGIPLAASAQDADGRITTVEFYNGTTLLTTERKLPYSYQWLDVPAGIYTITAVASDNYGVKTTSAPVTVTVTSPLSLALGKPSLNDKNLLNSNESVRLAPNPANDILNIYTNGLQQDKRSTISVISSSGVVMKTLQSNSLTKVVQLNVSSLANGVYTIKITSGKSVLHKQFIKL